MNFFEILEQYLNPAFWVVSNILLMYLSTALVAYVLVYGIRFRWREYEGGKRIFEFTLSLVGIVALVFIGVFVNSPQGWYIYPEDVLIWRPILRLVIFYTVALTLTRLNVILWRRLLAGRPLDLSVPPRTKGP